MKKTVCDFCGAEINTLEQKFNGISGEFTYIREHGTREFDICGKCAESFLRIMGYPKNKNNEKVEEE